MAISDLFVSWFPLLFGLFFFVSFLVDEVRKRGHLRLGRAPKKGEIIGLLSLLGFNLIVAFPVIIVGLFVEYTVGAPPFLELLLVAVMALADLIPIFLSGILSYFILKGFYDRWGVSIGIFFVTMVLSLLVLIDSVGLLQPGLPFIIEMVSTLVVVQFELVIIWVIFAVCLTRCSSSSKESKGSDSKQERTIGRLSIETALQLIVGFSKRIVNDADEEALEALNSIYESHPQCAKILTLAGKEVNIDLNSILSKRDLLYCQQALEFANGQFGKLKKWMRNIIVLIIVISPVSAVLTVISISMRFFGGIFFMMVTAIIPPILGLFGYQQSSRFEEGRYAPPAKSQFNSFLLTKDEFRRRVNRERVLFGFSLLILCGIIGASLLGVLPTGLAWIVVSVVVLIIGGILSTTDRTLSSKRLELPEMVERGLKFIGVEDIEELDGDSVLPEQSSELAPSKKTSPEVSLDWQQQLEARGHEVFAKKVSDKSREVYDEHAAIMIYMAVGGMMMFMGVLLYFLFTSFDFLSGTQILAIGFAGVGTPFFLYGSYNYLKMRNVARFHKLNRKNLTLLISYFDQKAQGVSDFGAMTDAHAPSEYLGFGIVSMFMHTFVRAAIVRLQYKTPWPKEEVERAWKTRSSYPKYESIGLIVSIIIFLSLFSWFSSFEIVYFPTVLKLLFLCSVGILIPTAAYSFIFYYIEKRALVEIRGVMHGLDDVTHLETLTALINLIESEFRMPLRVLLVGNYQDVSYTGRVYFTTTGVELREAVLIPTTTWAVQP